MMELLRQNFGCYCIKGVCACVQSRALNKQACQNLSEGSRSV